MVLFEIRYNYILNMHYCKPLNGSLSEVSEKQTNKHINMVVIALVVSNI